MGDEDTLGEHVAGRSQSVDFTCGLQTEPSRSFEQSPGAIVGIMVPLPLHSQWVVAEIVVRRQGLTGLYRQCRLSISGIGANGTYGSDRFTIFADDRPLVDPCHRLQVWYAA